MIFQEPSTALNPVVTIGRQISEAIRIHEKSVSRKEAMRRAVEIVKITAVPGVVLVDGNRPTDFGVPSETVVWICRSIFEV